jgi:hypothetical protein
VRQRTPLKPPSLLKDLNLKLIKDSTYQMYNEKTSKVKSSRRSRSIVDKIPVIHHLSSSFIPLEGVAIGSENLDSSYKKDYINIRKQDDINKYACPHGVKSSNGAASKYY